MSETEGGEKNAEPICSSTGSALLQEKHPHFSSALYNTDYKSYQKEVFYRSAQWVLIAQRRNILLMVLRFSATKSAKLLVRFLVGETQYSPQDCSTTFHSLHQLKNAHPWMLKKSNFEPEIHICVHIYKIQKINSLQSIPMEVNSKVSYWFHWQSGSINLLPLL